MTCSAAAHYGGSMVAGRESHVQPDEPADGARGRADVFPRTRWTSLVQPAQAGCESSLAALLDAYYAPLRRYLTCQWRLSIDQAQDVLQGFLADKVLGKGILAAARRAKGKFRTFLLAALKNYAIDQIRRNRARPDPEEIDSRFEMRDPGATAEEAFEYEWARQTVLRALENMEAECRRKKRADVWELFHVRMVGPILHGDPEVPYENLVARFGLKSPSAAFNLLVTGKRTFERHLRQVVGTYAREGACMEREIADLRSIFARGGGG